MSVLPDPSLREKMLLVYPDPAGAEALLAVLVGAGYRVEVARDGLEALHRLYLWRPDLVILDADLPRMDGWETCRRIRELCDVPVLVLSSDAAGLTQLDVLLSGADGCLGRPISGEELLCEVGRLLEGARSPLDRERRREVSVGELRIDLARSEVVRSGEPVDLSPPEFRLLAALASRLGSEVARGDLLAQVWGPEYADHEAYLDLYVYSLRRRIEEDPLHPHYLMEAGDTGYRLG